MVREIQGNSMRIIGFIHGVLVGLILLTFGLLIAEYKNCPKNSYSLDYGCRR